MSKSILAVLIIALSLCVCAWLKAEADDTSDDDSQNDTAMAFYTAGEKSPVEKTIFL
jgi:hypothetical protein